jgi:hypothetical protein
VPHNRRAPLAFTMATGGVSARSSLVNALPRWTEMPSVEKNSGVTVLR